LDKAQNFNSNKYYLLHVLKRYGFDSLNEIEKICSSEAGKMLKNNQFTILKDRNKLIVFKEKLSLLVDFFLKDRNKLIVFKEKSTSNDIYCINSKEDVLNLPFFMNILEVEKEEFNANLSTIFVNSNLLQWPLVLRRKKTGDVFRPFGMGGMKKVSKFFKDEKLSKIQKENTWILENGDGKIIWIVGLRADDRFKITNANQKNYKISLEK